MISVVLLLIIMTVTLLVPSFYKTHKNCNKILYKDDVEVESKIKEKPSKDKPPTKKEAEKAVDDYLDTTDYTVDISEEDDKELSSDVQDILDKINASND